MLFSRSVLLDTAAGAHIDRWQRVRRRSDGIIRRHLLGQIDVAVQIGAIGTIRHNNDTANGRGSSATALAGTIHPPNGIDRRDQP